MTLAEARRMAQAAANRSGRAMRLCGTPFGWHYVMVPAARWLFDPWCVTPENWP